MLNDATNELLLKLFILKNKIIENNLPDEDRILIGVGIIEQFIKNINPKELTNEEIDNIINHIYETIDNSFNLLSYSETKGMNMAINVLNKEKVLKYKK